MSLEVPNITVCSNCDKPIPNVNFTIHEIHCKRNNVRCDICNEVVNNHDLEQHKTQHNKLRCECGQMIEQRLIGNHKQSECTLRVILCKYCDIEYKAQDLFEHQDYCGNRTEFCPVCKKYIKLRDFQTHQDTNCSYPPPSENPEKSNMSESERRIDQIRAATLNDFFYLPPQSNPLGLKCPNCSESFQHETVFEAHIARCMTDDRVLTLSDGEVDCIPCEICNALISFSELEDHQIQCRIASEQSMHDEYEEMFHQTSQKRSKVSEVSKNKQTKSPVKPAPARLKKPDIIVIDDEKEEKSVPSTRVSRLNGPVSASTKVATRKPIVPTTTTVPPRVVTEPSHSAPATRKPIVPTTRSESTKLPRVTTTTSSKPVVKREASIVPTTRSESTKAAIANRKKPTPLSFKPIPGIQGKPATKKPNDNC